MYYLITLESRKQSADADGALAQLSRFEMKGVEFLLIIGGAGKGTTHIWVLVSLQDGVDVLEVKAEIGDLIAFETDHKHEVSVIVLAKAKS